MDGDSDRPTRVAVADDHYLVREGLRQLLELGDEVHVLASVGTATELLATLDGRRWTSS